MTSYDLKGYKLFINDNLLKAAYHQGLQLYFSCVDFTLALAQVKKFSIECNLCQIIVELQWASILYHLRKNKKEYLCGICKKTGARNPFYGKSHTEESKEKSRKSYGDRTGENNSFFGNITLRKLRKK